MTELSRPVRRPVIDVHLEDGWADAALATDVRRGLTSTPKSLPPKWFYDDYGSKLFDQITRLDEYYPTEAEREILDEHAATIAELTTADTLVELGSGTSDKTSVLIEAMWEGGRLERYVPFDVSAAPLLNAADELVASHPGLAVHGIVGDFEHHLVEIPVGGRKLVAFLGSTLGNLVPDERAGFLGDLAATLTTGDWFLLGVDLVKDTDRLVAAYDDPLGVTAAFNKNVLSVINENLAADFSLEDFEHVAHYEPDNAWIEMRLRARRDVAVTIHDLHLEVKFSAGEEILTEISAKFTEDSVRHELERAGFETVRWWTDERSDFGLSLSRYAR